MKAIVIMAIVVICVAVAQILTTQNQITVWRKLQQLQRLQFDGKQVADALKTTGIGLTDRQVKKMSIEKDIRFIAESIEWQNKLLAAMFVYNNSDGCDDESKFENDQSSDNDVLSE